MTTRKLLLHFSLLLMLSIPVCATYGQTRKRSDIDGTRSILISQYMARTGSEALLITDRKKISELVELFRNNDYVQHACGYHWIIWFRQNATHSIPFAHNEDCQIYKLNNERIHAVLNSYFSSILKSPTHYVVDVTVPAAMSPEDVVTKLENSEQQVYFFDKPDVRLPRIKIEATAISNSPVSSKQRERAEDNNLRRAQQQLANAIRTLVSAHVGASASPPDHRYSRGGGTEIEDRVESTITFPITTDVDSIMIPNSVHVLERTKPDSYVVELMSRQPLSSALCSTLMSTYPFVLDVRPYYSSKQ